MTKKQATTVTHVIDIKLARRVRWAPEASPEVRKALPWAWRVRAGQNTITGRSRSEDEARKNASTAALHLGGEHLKDRGRCGIELGTARKRKAA